MSRTTLAWVTALIVTAASLAHATGPEVFVTPGQVFSNIVNDTTTIRSITVFVTSGTVASSGSVTVTPGTGTWNVSGNGNFLVTPGTGAFNTRGNGNFLVTPGTGTFNTSGNGNFLVTPGTGTFTVVAVAGSTGSAVAVSVPATGTTQMLPLNAGRFHGEILNNSTTDLWVPASPAVIGSGWKVGPGATFTWDSTSPLYGVSGTGTSQVFTLDVTK